MRDRKRNRLRHHVQRGTRWGRAWLKGSPISQRFLRCAGVLAGVVAPGRAKAPHKHKSPGVAVALTMLTAIFALAASQAVAGGQGFRSPHVLQDHYSRFGKQFGNITVEQYLHLAQQLRDATPGRRRILISKRSDGGGSKFDVKRGWFVAFDGDGTLRTFFIPKDGIRYFEDQQKSAAPPE